MGHQKAEAVERQDKTRICIRLDADLVAPFKREAAKIVHSEEPAGSQTLIGEALREYIETEEYLQRVTRERLLSGEFA